MGDEVTFDSDQLTLTCISTGGPATTVTWDHVKLTAPKLTRMGRGLGVSALRLRVRTCSYWPRVTNQDTDCLLVLLHILGLLAPATRSALAFLATSI